MTWNLFVLLCLLSGVVECWDWCLYWQKPRLPSWVQRDLKALLLSTAYSYSAKSTKTRLWLKAKGKDEKTTSFLFVIGGYSHIQCQTEDELHGYLGEPERGVGRKGPFRPCLVAGWLGKGRQDTLRGLQLWHMVCLHWVTDVNDLIGQWAPWAISLQKPTVVSSKRSWYKRYSSRNLC